MSIPAAFQCRLVKDFVLKKNFQTSGGRYIYFSGVIDYSVFYSIEEWVN